MSAADVLADLRAAGIDVWAHEGHVRFAPIDGMTPELVARVAECKSDVLMSLRHEGKTRPVCPMLRAVDLFDGAFAEAFEPDQAEPRGEPEAGRVSIGDAVRHLGQLGDHDRSRRPCYACGSRRWVRHLDAPVNFWSCATCSPPPRPEVMVWADGQAPTGDGPGHQPESAPDGERAP